MGAALFSLCPGGEKQRGCGGGTPLPSGRGFGDGAAETKRYSPIRQQASRASRRTRARRGGPLCGMLPASERGDTGMGGRQSPDTPPRDALSIATPHSPPEPAGKGN